MSRISATLQISHKIKLALSVLTEKSVPLCRFEIYQGMVASIRLFSSFNTDFSLSFWKLKISINRHCISRSTVISINRNRKIYTITKIHKTNIFRSNVKILKWKRVCSREKNSYDCCMGKRGFRRTQILTKIIIKLKAYYNKNGYPANLLCLA